MIRIMLIEQEKLYQKVFQKIIKRHPNCELVAIAENGLEAMKAMEEHHPQMIFSEVLLGSENGIDVLRGIKNRYPEADTYVLTEYNSLSLMQNAMRAGVEQYLYKPLSQKMCDQLFMENDPQEKKEDVHLVPILRGIENHDYKEAYDATEEYVRYLFEDCNEESRGKILRQILLKLIFLVPGMEQEQKNYYLQKYEPDYKIFTKKMHCYCWIVSVYTEVFRQLCVMKYTQMNKVFQHIENNINSEISMVELAQKAGISSGYLSRVFKKYYRISMVDYIHLRKIVVAKHYMVYSDMNISDISFLLGYSEAGYFCKIFKKYEKITPSEYTERYHKTSKK